MSETDTLRNSDSARERPMWRTVAIPSEHGGWGLTLEPVVLGLAVAPSLGGLALGLAAFLAFVVRTPLKLAIIDRRRGRWLERSSLAARVALVELALLVGLVAVALRTSGWPWIVPVAIAAPLVGVELWFDVRSRGRRLIPELCGSIGMAAVVAVVVVAGGRSGALAAGAWLVLAGRSVGAIPFVRTQIGRLRHGSAKTGWTDAAQLGAIALGGAAVAIEHRMLAGSIGLVALAAVQAMWVRRPPTAAKVLGLRQMALGLGLVAVTAGGVLAW